MKKTILFLAAAAMALVACNKTRISDPEANNGEAPVRFRVAMSTITKGNPYTGTELSELSTRIPIVSSTHYADGTIIAPKTEFNYLSYDNNYWYLSTDGNDRSNVFPLGDTRMDLLSFYRYLEAVGYQDFPEPYFDPDGGALDTDYLTAYNEGWGSREKANWIPVLTDNKNYANKAYFINVSTPEFNYDIMYGSANEIKKGENVRTLNLKHAMAALYFNVAFADNVPENVSIDPPLFIIPGDPSSDFYKALLYTDGMNYNRIDSDLQSYLNSGDYYNYLSLKTVGTLIIDNSKNNLEASWYLGNWDKLGSHWSEYYSYISSSGYGFAYLGNDSYSNSINTVATDKLDLEFNGYVASMGTVNPDTYYQVGVQLIPEQPIVNPWLRYRINGQIYLTEINLPRGTWQMGHAYIYNLKLNFNGVKFTVTVEPYEYLTGGYYLEY